MSYSAPNIATLLPQWVHIEAHVWCINTSVLNFSTVEWYNADRVMQQFGQLMIVPDHDYRRGSQPMGELEDQHMVELDSEDQPLNTLDQWVDAFYDGSRSNSYHLDIGGLSSYHPDMGSLSPYLPEQPMISFDLFGNNMYFTPPQATFDPAADLSL
ncbi:hypothetical protein GOBAR_DD27534 [Gossypium barbadense]|nr:hypothetical protein GOBAR_DD27534 [Gossypium barbadense]